MQKIKYIMFFSLLIIGAMGWAQNSSTVADKLIPGAVPKVDPSQQQTPQIPQGYFVTGNIRDQSNIPCGLQIENQGDDVVIRAGQMGPDGVIANPPEFKIDNLLWSMFKRYNNKVSLQSPDIPMQKDGWFTSVAIQTKDNRKQMDLKNGYSYGGFWSSVANFSISGAKTVDELALLRTSEGGNLSDGSSLSFETTLSGKSMTCDITADR